MRFVHAFIDTTGVVVCCFSALRAQQRVTSSFDAGKESHVTPFFATLFPVLFADESLGADTTLRSSDLLRRLLCCRGTDTRAAPDTKVVLPSSSPSPKFPPFPRHPWHALWGLKHIALHATNGENDSGSAGGLFGGDASAGVVEKKTDGATTRQLMAPAAVTQLLCRSARAIRRRRRFGVGLLDETALAANTRQHHKRGGCKSQKVLGEAEGEALSEDLQRLSREACMAHVFNRTKSANGATALPLEALRFLLTKTLHVSSYTFHSTFETLVRHGQERMAIEFFRRWWRHNPHLFPIDLNIHFDGELVSLVQSVRARGGDTLTNYCREITRYTAQIPYKKYTVSSALFTRVLMVALRLGDPVLNDEFIIQEVIYNGVFVALCHGGSAGCDEQHDGSNTPGTCDSHDKLHFYAFKEKYEDWLVLIGAVAAAALIERHAGSFLREIRDRNTYDGLVHKVYGEFITFIQKASYPNGVACVSEVDSFVTANLAEKPTASLNVHGWAKFLFTTIFRCYEDSGVFHPSHARRPGNTSSLWEQIHLRLLRQFPHVFHAGSTVATLLSFAALEEMAVSSMGTHRTSFCGKEEALCSWRLECLAQNATQDGLSGGVTNVYLQRGLSDLPRVSRRLQSRFVTAYSSFSTASDEVTITDTRCSDGNNNNDGIARMFEEKKEQQHKQQLRAAQLHRKHLEQFGAPFSVAASRLSIPVFATAQEVKSYAEDALWEIYAIESNALSVFRDHSSLLMLHPAASVGVLHQREQRSCDEIVAEASQPSIFLFLRLISFLAFLGEPVATTVKESGGEERSSNDSYHGFPLVECVEKDILPHCHPSVAAFLRRCCVTYLSRSGARGLEALVTDYQALLEELSEKAAVERLLIAVLWCGESNREAKPLPNHFSFGSGSLAWRVIAQHHEIVFCSDDVALLEMILSHLLTLSIAIPDDYRRVVCVSPYMHSVFACVATEDSSAVVALQKELSWNMRPALHMYISMLELLSWALGKKKKEEILWRNTEKEGFGAARFSEDDEPDDNGEGGIPSLFATARNWTRLQRCFRSCLLSSVSPFPPFILERICLILLHSCPDVELLTACLLTLRSCQHLDMPSKQDGNGSYYFAADMKDEKVSFVTPRLLTSLCCLLVLNGVNRNHVEEWRLQNAALQSSSHGISFGNDTVDSDVLHKWHLLCFERLMPSAGKHILKEDKTDFMEHFVFNTEVATRLLGSIVLDILFSDTRWNSLKKDNYYVSLFVLVNNGLPSKDILKTGLQEKSSSFPLGVVLPSRQMASAYPAGVRQRVTNIKDALRELGAEGRLRLHNSLSPQPQSTEGENSRLLNTYGLTDADKETGEKEEETWWMDLFQEHCWDKCDTQLFLERKV